MSTNAPQPQPPTEQVSTSLPLDSPNGVDGRDSGFSSGGSSGKDPSTSSGTNSGSNCETSSGSGSGSNSANEGSTGSKSETKAALMQSKKPTSSTKRTLSDTLPKQVESVGQRASSNSKYRKLDEMFSNEEAKWNGETPLVSSSSTPTDKFFSPPASDKATIASTNSRRRYRSKSPQRSHPDSRRDDYTRSSAREDPPQRRQNRNSYYPDYSRDARDAREHRDQRDRDQRDSRDRDSRDFDRKPSRGNDRDSRNTNGWERYRPDWVQEWDTYRNRDSERARARYRRWETEHERNYERRGPVSKNPELSSEERDKRTVYVQQVAPHVQSTELFDFFEEAGPVHDVSLVKDRSSRCRGVAFVEFEDVASVARAIGLTGRSLHGQALLVRCTDSVRNRQEQAESNNHTTASSNGNGNSTPTTNGTAAATNSTASTIDSVRFHRLYVGNIYFGVSEGEIIQIFEAFGPIEFADLQKEKTGKSKGYCFIQYVNPDDAKTALEKMNGFELAGRKLRVGLGLGERGATKARQILTEIGLLAADGVSRSADQVATQLAVDRQNQKLKLKDKRLQQRQEEQQQRASPVFKHEPEQADKTAEFSSKCAVLRNMFNYSEESGNWVEELREDVRLECEEKFGPLASISLEVEKGEIYLRFLNEMDCVKAVNNLHQRYFGGRVINASHISEQDFDKSVQNQPLPTANNQENVAAEATAA